MGRKTEFDTNKALLNATELFWQNGYMNTSLKDLLKVMKLGESSFYHAFKSKKKLYLQCIKFYADEFMAERVSKIQTNESCRTKLEAFFDVVISDFAKSEKTGCMTTNTLAKEIISDDDIKDFLFTAFDEFVDYLTFVISEGIKNNEFDKNINPKDTARIIFTYMHGFNRLSVYKFDKEDRQRETKLFLDMIFPSSSLEK